MGKWIEARVVHLKEGQAQEIEDDERVVSATFDTPDIWVVVVKERPTLYDKDPELIDGSIESQPGGTTQT